MPGRTHSTRTNTIANAWPRTLVVLKQVWLLAPASTCAMRVESAGPGMQCSACPLPRTRRSLAHLSFGPTLPHTIHTHGSSVHHVSICFHVLEAASGRGSGRRLWLCPRHDQANETTVSQSGLGLGDGGVNLCTNLACRDTQALRSAWLRCMKAFEEAADEDRGEASNGAAPIPVPQRDPNSPRQPGLVACAQFATGLQSGASCLSTESARQAGAKPIDSAHHR